MWLDLLVIVVCFVVFERASDYLIEGLASVRVAERHRVGRTLRGDGCGDAYDDVAHAGVLQVCF